MATASQLKESILIEITRITPFLFIVVKNSHQRIRLPSKVHLPLQRYSIHVQSDPCPRMLLFRLLLLLLLLSLERTPRLDKPVVNV